MFYLQMHLELRKELRWVSLEEIRLELNIKKYAELRWGDLSQNTLNVNVDSSEILSSLSLYKNVCGVCVVEW